MITIREYDNTKSPVGAYANFTVLVPGYWEHTATRTDSPFGTEPALEFTSQKVFADTIGRVPATTAEIAAVACKLQPLSFVKGGTTEPSRLLQKDKIFYKQSAAVSETATAGYLVDEAGYTYERFISDGVGTVTATDKIYISNDFDTEYTYTGEGFIDWDEVTVGSNKIEANQYGNQFAYELLGLGYTVLYADLETLKTIYPVADYGTGVFTPFTDKAAYDFRYILPGVMTGAYSISGETVTDEVAAFNLQAIKCANTRQDCTALCDLNATAYLDTSLTTMGDKIERVRKLAYDLIANAQITVNNQTVKGEYTALFANRPTYNISYGTNGVYTNKTFACGFHYLACAARARENFAEWYAVGGYTRGKSYYVIDKLDINFGDAAVEALQPRNGSAWENQNQTANCVNVMVNIKGQLLLWGNNTAKDLETDGTDSELDTLKAGHFLNIRQLCTTIKKQVYVTCRRLTFNPNSSRLWSDFKGMVEPTLALAKSDQGCDDYLMTRVQDRRKAMMTAKIRIVPIEAVKDFDISLFLEDSISGVVIGEDESAG